MKKTIYIFVLISMLTFSVLPMFAGEKENVVVIVNKANPMKEIKVTELKDIYLSIQKKWKDDSEILAYNLSSGSPERTLLQKEVLGSTPKKLKDYWVKKKIQGKEEPPQSKSSALIIAKFVSIKKNAIGYVKKSIADKIGDKIKILKINFGKDKVKDSIGKVE